ncbi:uncharacterized protein DUF3883 [Dyadobacter jejuensis]|uniref:Uncharacterized protein DUF3883 n=1 Tax=Dyadobacter jejuensis TaxID=1082580 RepID=A0A316AUW2_9BACT|nr:DUF3883 domain-containing protein [Dyadobacter jejuensis]PWJ53887.1 uncharacterized protein DUF3883 [Dyadobacter jejuensis]
MNTQKVRDIIKQYKLHFKAINKEEIYKWRAVKCFQENWDIDADDFATMLDSSLHLAKNLLDAGNYFPKRMLLKNAEANPKFIRQLFVDLYKEENDLIERIIDFQDKIKNQNKKLFPGKNDYQDMRAVLVYLCLRFPDRYFLYKFSMFKEFAPLVDYPYKPSIGEIENVLQFLSLCDLVKAEIVMDNELLELHKTRITDREFYDSSFKILTQDIIYAAVRHFSKFEQGRTQTSALKRLIKVDKKISPKTDKVVLKGSFTNYIDNEKENKRIGDLGELLVLQHEQEKLKSLGIKKSPEHKSKSEGDGLGYDILSYDEGGQEIFIEVKTTSYSSDTPFFITRNELVCSMQDSNKFFLYRLYDFDDTDNKAKYFKRQGDLTELCNNSILYRAVLKE